jgi:CDGSH-type Zn-finger protein
MCQKPMDLYAACAGIRWKEGDAGIMVQGQYAKYVCECGFSESHPKPVEKKQ